jgi:hypothetical protein
MLAKIGFVVGGVALATFMMGRVESLVAHGGFAGSTAWAQAWDDPADDADVDSQPAAVPNITGTYSGPAVDSRFGNGSIAVAITTQNGSNVSGSWETDLGGGAAGPVTGKVKPNSKVKLKMKISGHCGLLAQGSFHEWRRDQGPIPHDWVRSSQSRHLRHHGLVIRFPKLRKMASAPFCGCRATPCRPPRRRFD